MISIWCFRYKKKSSEEKRAKHPDIQTYGRVYDIFSTIGPMIRGKSKHMAGVMIDSRGRWSGTIGSMIYYIYPAQNGTIGSMIFFHPVQLRSR